MLKFQEALVTAPQSVVILHLPVFMFSNQQDAAEEAGSQVTGGQTVLNPWLTIGGVATAVCQPNEYIL